MKIAIDNPRDVWIIPARPKECRQPKRCPPKVGHHNRNSLLTISRKCFECVGSSIHHSRYFSQLKSVSLHTMVETLNLLSLNLDHSFQPVQVASLPVRNLLFVSITSSPLRLLSKMVVYHGRQATSTRNRPENPKRELAHFADVPLVECRTNILNACRNYRQARGFCLS